MADNEFCKGMDLFKSGNFKLLLKPPAKNIEWWVQECNIPGYNLGEMNMHWIAQDQKRPGDEIVWNTLTMSILLDEKLTPLREAQELMFRFKNPETGAMLPPNEEVFDAQLIVFTNKNNHQLTFRFFDAWISNIGDVQLSHTTSEDDQVICQMDVVYDYYKIEALD